MPEEKTQEKGQEPQPKAEAQNPKAAAQNTQKSEQNPASKQSKNPKLPEPKKPETKKVSDILQSVHIALDSYDDIFSDFDPSPYETRILSDDFLNELHKHYLETPKGSFQIVITLPHAFRSEKKETLIRKRMKDYFKGRLKDLEKSMKERLKRGVTRAMVGLLISLSVLLTPLEWHTFITALISPLLWFLMWTGFESIFDVSSKMKKKRAFFEKFMKAEYTFLDEEGVLGEAMQYTESSYR
jgi:hypothetical protein